MTGLAHDDGRAHPLVRQLFGLMRDSKVCVTKYAAHVGVTRKVFCYWRHGHSPTLVVFIAAANALGYEVVLKPKGDALE